MMDRDDAVVLRGRGRPRFAQEPSPALLAAGRVRLHRLYGDAPARAAVLRLDDDAHAALAEQPQQTEAARPADLVKRLRRREEGEGRRPRAARVLAPGTP